MACYRDSFIFFAILRLTDFREGCQSSLHWKPVAVSLSSAIVILTINAFLKQLLQNPYFTFFGTESYDGIVLYILTVTDEMMKWLVISNQTDQISTSSINKQNKSTPSPVVRKRNIPPIVGEVSDNFSG
jgi:hypothetical protein